MSIAVVCNVPDGVVIGADSAITVAGPHGVFKVFEDAEKVFALRHGGTGLEECYAAAATYGLGLIGTRTVEAYVRDFCDRKGGQLAKLQIKEACQELHDWLEARYEEEVRPRVEQQRGLPLEKIPAQERPMLGVAVAGYSPDCDSPEVWNTQIPRPAQGDMVQQYKAPGQFGVSWWGFVSPVTRFVKGFEPALASAIDYLVKKHNVQLGEDEKQEFNRLVGQSEWQIPYEAMPLQEAVNLTKFVLSLSINWARFHVGAPVCGGPIRLAVISRGGGFEWVQQPKLEVRPI
jgi:hypothetical protein